MKPRSNGVVTAVLLAALAVTGCGLKGALTMPSKSDEVVIRAPGETAPPADGATATPPAAPAETTEDDSPAPKRPRDDRIPPPPLPGGNPGTSRGG